jgi:addiction module HigA family antidote
MSAAELARQIAVPTNRITAILKGQRTITGDTAFRLAHFFGISVQFWLNLQSLYELRLARRNAGNCYAVALGELGPPRQLIISGCIAYAPDRPHARARLTPKQFADWKDRVCR